jgi:hypothetical protein
MERLFSRSPYSIVTLVARIRGTVSESMLRDAVAKARRRHTHLRVRIVDDDDGNPCFTSEGAGALPVEVVPRQSADQWIKVVRETCKVPFQFDAHPPIRFILVQSPDASELVILCHHIICDGLSLAYLARDLLAYLGDPDRAVERLPDPEPITRDTMPEDLSLNPVVRFLIRRMNRRWETEKVVFDHEDYRDLNAAYWMYFDHKMLSLELSEAQTSDIVDRCRSEGVTVNSALTAAFVGAQTVVQGRRPHHASIGVAASLRDRLRRPVSGAMGFYAAVVTLTCRYQSHRGFWDNARRFHRRVRPLLTNEKLFQDPLTWSYLEPSILESIHFKKVGGLVLEHFPRYQKLSAFCDRDDIVLRLLKRDKMDSLDQIALGTAVTNLTRLDFPRAYGALELDRLIMKPGGAFPLANVNLLLGAVTCAGKLSLMAEFVEENLSVSTMEEIGNRALEWLLWGE